jgi:hypothetical protein
MDIFFLEATAVDIMDVADRNEGLLIKVADDVFEFRFLEATDDAKDDFFAVAGEGTFSV